VNDFITWRAGRLKPSELMELKNACDKNKFIEFFGFISTSLSLKLVSDEFVVL
jgi:hypothetical protein